MFGMPVAAALDKAGAPGRAAAIAAAQAWFDGGAFAAVLARRVAYRTESQRADAGPPLRACLADVLGLPTGWVPHSYPACSQHAPNEHLLGSVAREGLAIMTGVFWDLGAPPPVH